MRTSVGRQTYTLREAAALLGVSHWLAGEEVRRSDKLAGIPVIRIGRRVLIPRHALDRVVEGEAVEDATA